MFTFENWLPESLDSLVVSEVEVVEMEGVLNLLSEDWYSINFENLAKFLIKLAIGDADLALKYLDFFH